MKTRRNTGWYTLFIVLALLFLAPIFIVLMNSFKGKFFHQRKSLCVSGGRYVCGHSQLPGRH